MDVDDPRVDALRLVKMERTGVLVPLPSALRQWVDEWCLGVILAGVEDPGLALLAYRRSTEVDWASAKWAEMKFPCLRYNYSLGEVIGHLGLSRSTRGGGRHAYPTISASSVWTADKSTATWKNAVVEAGRLMTKAASGDGVWSR